MQSAKHFLDLDGSESPEEVDAAYRQFEPIKARLDKYFHEMQPMLAAEKRGEIDHALSVAMAQIADLPKWVDLFIAAYRKLDVGFPCVNLALRYLPALGRQDEARFLKEQLSKRPELIERYQEFLAQMDIDFATAAILVEYLSRTPGCKQNEVGKEAGLPGRDVARLLKTMEKARLVTRTKVGKTNLIQLARVRAE